MWNVFVVLILVVLFAILAMWVVRKFAEELGAFLVKFLTVVIVVVVVCVVVYCVLALFGAGGAHLPHIVGSLVLPSIERRPVKSVFKKGLTLIRAASNIILT